MGARLSATGNGSPHCIIFQAGSKERFCVIVVAGEPPENEEIVPKKLIDSVNLDIERKTQV